MKSDIEIAQSVSMEKIINIAEKKDLQKMILIYTVNISVKLIWKC